MTDGNWRERYVAWNDLGQCLAAISGWCLLAMKRERYVAGRGGPVVSGTRGLNFEPMEMEAGGVPRLQTNGTQMI